MDNTEKKILQLENDVATLLKFKEEISKRFNEREPAPKTWDFINTMKVEMALNSKDHEELKAGIKSIEKKLDDVINNAPNKDNSWAESVLKIIGYIVLTILVGAFMFLVIKENLIH